MFNIFLQQLISNSENLDENQKMERLYDLF